MVLSTVNLGPCLALADCICSFEALWPFAGKGTTLEDPAKVTITSDELCFVPLPYRTGTRTASSQRLHVIRLFPVVVEPAPAPRFTFVPYLA